jgi:hypothetical protein
MEYIYVIEYDDEVEWTKEQVDMIQQEVVTRQISS